MNITEGVCLSVCVCETDRNRERERQREKETVSFGLMLAAVFFPRCILQNKQSENGLLLYTTAASSALVKHTVQC